MRAAQVQRWTAIPEDVDAHKAQVAKRLLDWLTHSDVQEYTSSEGYKLLIVRERRP